MSTPTPALAELLDRAAAERTVDDSAAALQTLADGARIAPNDAQVAAHVAQVTSDAGLDAVDAFVEALRRNPAHDGLRLGLAGALVARGQADYAESLIDQALEQRRGWIEGHEFLSRLRFMRGDPDHARSYAAALARNPADAALWRHRIGLAMHEERFADALELVAAAERATGPSSAWLAHRAACLDELGEREEAAATFARLGPPADAGTAVRVVRHLLRRGEVSAAYSVSEPWLGAAGGESLWPYVALAWRLGGDPRSEWLEGAAQLVGVYDIGAGLGDLGALAERLRGLHRMSLQPLDQSLRGGTQTDGYLLSRLEPEFRALRAALADAVTGHLAQLPRRDPFHPVLKHRRDRPVRFSGAWSVRLTNGGRHVSHVHPLGWFSSALYVALPDALPGDEGHLVLGEGEELLGLDLPPRRVIAPAPGRLVLFPSIMWHGTRPFAAGERLTVAFDVAKPD